MESQQEQTQLNNQEELKSQEHNFDADISQLMNLIVNAFYSKKEIFLRELLSNSSDALEKIRYESLTDNTVLDSNKDLKIKVWVDSNDKTIVIEDTGIGMTRYDLIHNLGTIARSGTKKFMENISQSDKSIDQIGQFGVGFYSSYLVSDKVTLYTKHNDECEYIWESTANKSYTITENPNPTLQRGTRIVLHIKEDQNEYLDIEIVKNVIKRYTQFINFPIELQESREIDVDVEEDVEEVNDDNEEIKVEEVDSDEDEIKGKKTEKKTVTEWNVINNQKPIWCRNADDITNEEYQEFYKSISNDYSDSMAHKHFHAEGQIEFNCLLYVPEKSPFDMFDSKEKKSNIKLYVKRIFIMDDCNDLIPEWLKFVKGVVDSNDIPLNVSRELLQQNSVLKQINKVIVKKSIELFNEIAEDKDKYKKFYDNYSKMIKLGVHEDNRNRDKLMKLLRFNSSNNSEEYISLDDYVSNMKEGQDKIYFITGQNNQSVLCSPFIEKLTTEGYDVLLFTDPIDEYMVQSAKDYEGKTFSDVSKEGIKFNEEELKVQEEENKDLIKFLKDTLGEKVQSVKISDRLSDTPCVLVTSEQGWSANMERIIKSQALRNSQMDSFMGSKKIFEINMNHKIIKTLKVKMNDEESLSKCVNIVLLLFDTAQINSGFTLEKPSEYANKVNRMVELGFCEEEEYTEEEIAYNKIDDVMFNKKCLNTDLKQNVKLDEEEDDLRSPRFRKESELIIDKDAIIEDMEQVD